MSTPVVHPTPCAIPTSTSVFLHGFKHPSAPVLPVTQLNKSPMLDYRDDTEQALDFGQGSHEQALFRARREEAMTTGDREAVAVLTHFMYWAITVKHIQEITRNMIFAQLAREFDFPDLGRAVFRMQEMQNRDATVSPWRCLCGYDLVRPAGLLEGQMLSRGLLSIRTLVAAEQVRRRNLRLSNSSCKIVLHMYMYQTSIAPTSTPAKATQNADRTPDGTASPDLDDVEADGADAEDADADGNCVAPVACSPPTDVVAESISVLCELELELHPSKLNSPEMYVCVSVALMLHVGPSRHVLRFPSGGLSSVPSHTHDPTVPLHPK
ncbi:hypothetical protein DFH07DRAFT_955912 [Mycena maculata]|uniref:Uncharacterized protein n=1 Tax=Mycena maculata TaxID=230809 RepID=A0AAD7JHU4_9AGAR|nr:hypothetical protein DFH07DRAFT_955912 [Mycena maculata]